MNNIEYIKENFTEIKLNTENFHLYTVRKSILSAINCNLVFLKGNLLDVGCGIMPYKEIIKKNKNIINYTGMDLENASYHGQVPPDLFWDGQIIPVEESNFDSIIATEFLEHYHDTKSILLEMNRVLKPEGFIFGTVPFIWNLHETPYDEYRFTPYSLEKHLEQAGFKNIKIQALGGSNMALAQLFCLWFKIKHFRGKRFLKYPFLYFVKWLIRNDQIPKDFDNWENSLFNSLSFSAYK
jgi:SAM-dependent methyltransferase